MDIFYYGARDTNGDSPINIGCIVDALIRRERMRNQMKGRHYQRLLIEAGNCQRCKNAPGGKGNIAFHHITPIWVFALSLVLSNPPKTYEESNEMTYAAILDRLMIGPECHDASNLQVLCRRCHEKIEGEVTANWRRIFIERGAPIEWSKR